MIKLHTHAQAKWDGEPIIARVSTNRDLPIPIRGQSAFLSRRGESSPPEGFEAYVRIGDPEDSPNGHAEFVVPDELNYLCDGDIVRLNPRNARVRVMYRRSSRFNYVMLTERCNSNCVMCSQPPQTADDSFLVGEYLKAIPLMSPDSTQIGITGGEPTLLKDDLFRIIRACKNWLPSTYLHMLSNGRLFSYLSLCKEISQIGHPDFTIGIPLYSDLACDHDFVVQAENAFDETIRGIMNLKRYGVRVEIRVVLHSYTIERLPQLASFIVRNLPFVDHVALMGLELMGYTKMNLDALWIDPADYQNELSDAVATLSKAGLNTSIYNHQLCVLRSNLWPYARQSISDWKNEYIEECNACAVRDKCGGFFSSGLERHSRSIKAIHN